MCASRLWPSALHSLLFCAPELLKPGSSSGKLPISELSQGIRASLQSTAPVNRPKMPLEAGNEPSFSELPDDFSGCAPATCPSSPRYRALLAPLPVESLAPLTVESLAPLTGYAGVGAYSGGVDIRRRPSWTTGRRGVAWSISWPTRFRAIWSRNRATGRASRRSTRPSVGSRGPSLGLMRRPIVARRAMEWS